MLTEERGVAQVLAASEYPTTLEANPTKFAEILKTYEHGAIVVAGVSTLALTGIGHLSTWYMSGSERVSTAGFAVCWVLAFLTFPLFYLTRRALLRQQVYGAPRAFWLQSALQLTWLALLSWYSTPGYVPVLFFVLCVLLFNDARYFYDSSALKASYASMWLGQIVVLLLIDAGGGDGLIASLRMSSHRTVIALGLEVCVTIMCLVMISVVGKSHFEHDAVFHKTARLEAALSAMRSERQVITRSCDFLLHGLSASRFSHDVASPLSVLSMEVDRLREFLERDSKALTPQITRCLNRIEEAAERAENLTRALARSLREPSEFVEVPLSRLIQESAEHATRALQRHAVEMRAPAVDVADVSVTISRDHAAAIGNVIVNGVLQDPEQAIQIQGESVSEYFCRVSIRDWGVAENERSGALARVNQQMSLQAMEAQARSQDYDGYGIGLLLTKALVVRWGGWISVREPREGRGLRFDIVLPRVPSKRIPEEFNRPETF